MTDIPVLTLNGEKIQAIKPKAVAWRKIVEFDETKKDLPASEYITKHCAILSYFFPVEAERIENEADIDEITYIYHEVFAYVTDLLTAKLGAVTEKNGKAAE